MSEETEGDMAAAELEAEAERDNTPAPLPPCGPERDAVEAAADEVYSVSYELYSQGLGDGHPLGRSYGREYEGLKTDLREAVAALIAAVIYAERGSA